MRYWSIVRTVHMFWISFLTFFLFPWRHIFSPRSIDFIIIYAICSVFFVRALGRASEWASVCICVCVYLAGKPKYITIIISVGLNLHSLIPLKWKESGSWFQWLICCVQARTKNKRNNPWKWTRTPRTAKKSIRRFYYCCAKTAIPAN